jgi:CRISPR/Cas system-associated exonuclease Cas4 (RecB family)
MPLSPSFLFSQSNLQDYSDCPRRFYLKHIRRLAWPSIESEPIQENEHFRLQGDMFHKMVHQFFLGIPPERLSNFSDDLLLRNWWDNFFSRQDELLHPDEAQLFPEVIQSTVLNSHRLLAKYDLFAIYKDGKYCIYDWKTYRKRPRREHLARKMQTRLYPLILIHGVGTSRSQQPITPEQLNMIYWYTNFPEQPEYFDYSQVQYKKDLQYFSNLLSEIDQASESDNEENFPMTDNTDRCLFCIYRSLCNRGIRAGNLDQSLSALEIDDSTGEAVSLESFDFDHVSEIEF